MSRSIENMAREAFSYYDADLAKEVTKFAQLMMAEIVAEIKKQPNPMTLNYKPAERIAETVESLFDLTLNELTGVKFKKIPKTTDVYTLEEFKQCVETGCFIPDDGSGYFMKNDREESNISVWSTDEAPSWATHVSWYNK